jgi:hypothetical protein
MEPLLSIKELTTEIQAESTSHRPPSKKIKNTEGGQMTPPKPKRRPRRITWRRIAEWLLMGLFVSIGFNIAFLFYTPSEIKEGIWHIDAYYWWVFGVGFLAQMVKGTLGLGYGVTATISLMSLNTPLPAIGSSVNAAKVFASASIAWAYYKSGKLNKWLLFKATLIPGIVGAVIGASLLAIFGEKSGDVIKPFIAAYAAYIGYTILKKAAKRRIVKSKVKWAGLSAMIGGFLDSFCGGGWGPLVTSGLISKGRNPHYVIGSMSLTEFFVTIASSITFFILIGFKYWFIMLTLLLGGFIAAPISVRLAGKLSVRWMFWGVGSMVIFWSLRTLWKLFF